MTLMYLLDSNQDVIEIVPKGLTLELWQEMGINEIDTLHGTMILNPKLKSKIDETFYVGVPDMVDKHSFNLYRLIKKEVTNTEINIQGIQLGFDELASKGYIKDMRPNNEPFQSILSRLLQDSGWSLGFVDDRLPIVNGSFYYMNRLEAIGELINLTGAELKFKVAISNNKITDKYVEAYLQMGSDSGKRFTYGSNSLDIVAEENVAELYTAILGRGRGEEISSADDNASGQAGYGRKIDFAEIEWKKSSGNPVDKPKGQEYVEIPEATEMFGFTDGSPRLLIKDYPNIDDPAQLIQASYRDLLDYSRPKVQFKTKVENVGNLHVGDTVSIIRYDLDLKYQARVFKVKYNRLDLGASEIDLGDALTDSNAKSQAKFRKQVSREIREVDRAIENTYVIATNGTRVSFGADEPENKKVDDVWYETMPDGTVRLRIWNGNEWIIEVSDTFGKEVEEQVKEAVGEIEEVRESANKANEDINQAIQDAGFTSLSDTILNIQEISNNAQDNASTAIENAKNAGIEAGKAMEDAQSAITQAELAMTQVGDISLVADNALSNAESAMSSAESAMLQSNNALGLANDAVESSSNALTKAESAISSASSAQTMADELSKQVSDFSIDVEGFTQTVNDYEGQVSSLESTVSGLRSDIVNYEIELDEFGNEVGRYATEVSTMQNTVDGFRSDVVNYETEVLGFADDVTSYKNQLSTMENTVDGFTSTVASYTTEVDEFGNQVASYATEVSTFSNTVDGLNSTVSNFETEIVGYRGDVVLYTNQVSELENTVDGFSSTVAEYTTELDELGVEVASYATQVSSFTNSLDGFTSTVASYEVELDEFGEVVGTYATEVSTLTNTVEGLNSTVAEYETEIIGYRGDVTQYQNQVSTMENTVRGFNNTVAQYTTEVDEFGNQVGAYATQVSTLENTVDGLNSTVATYGNEVNNYATQVSTLTNTVNGFNSTVSQVQYDLDNLEIGGRNLLRNTSSELKTHSKEIGYDWNTQNLNQRDLDRLNIGVGDEITLSVYIDNPTQGASAFIQFNLQGPTYRQNRGNTIAKGQSGWSRVTVKISSADLRNFDRMAVAVRGSSDGSGTVRISSKKLEKGNIPTDWTPAPEDMATSSKVSTLENTIDGFRSEVSKVEKDYQGLSGTVASHTSSISNINGQIALKANTTTVNALTGRMSTAESSIKVNADGIKLKASQSSVNTLTGRVTTAESGITTNANAIKLKASQTSVNTLTGEVRDLGSQIDVTAGQISSKVWQTDIDGAIDNVQIGGRNLLQGTSDKLVTYTKTSWDWYIQNINANQLKNMNVKVGDEITLSVFIDNPSENAAAFIQFTSRTPSYRQNYGNYITKGNSGWSEVTVKVSSADLNNLNHMMAAIRGSNGSATARFSMKKLERGNIATDWSPAPEDVQKEINSVQSDVTQKHNSITSTVSSLDGRVATQKTTLDSISSTVSGHGGRLSTVEQTAKGLQTTVASKASQTQVTQLAEGLSSVVSDVNAISNPNLLEGFYGDYTDVDFYGWNQQIYNGGEPIWIPVIGGRTYTASALVGWITNYPAGVRIFWYDSNKGLIRESGSSNFIEPGVGGTPIVTDVAPSNAEFARFVYRRNSGGAVKSAAKYRYQKFEEGDKRTGYQTPPSSESRITQLTSDINLRVTKGSLMSEINVQAGRTLISSSRIYLDSSSVVFSGNAFIPSAAITSLTASKINTGTLNANNVSITNLDVNDLVGNKATFIRSSFQSVSSNLDITSKGIKVSAGSFNVWMDFNGIDIEDSTKGNARMGSISGLVSNETDEPNSIALLAEPNYAISLSANKSGNNYQQSLRVDGVNGTLRMWAVRHIGFGWNSRTGPNQYGSLTYRDGTGHLHLHADKELWLSSSANKIFLGARLDMDNRRIEAVNSMHLNGGGRIYTSASADSKTGHQATAIYAGGTLSLGAGSKRHMRIYTYSSGNGGVDFMSPLNMSGWNIDNVNILTFNEGVSPGNNRMYGTGGTLSMQGSNRWELGTRRGDALQMAGSNNGTNSYLSAYANINMQGNNLTNTSDLREKTNIEDSTFDALSSILNWRFVDFDWINSEYKPEGRQYGLIAQWTEDIVLYDEFEKVYSINSSKQIMMNSHAIQQLGQGQLKIKDLAKSNEDKIHELQMQISKANDRIRELEGKS